jgi:hypothetical protein
MIPLSFLLRKLAVFTIAAVFFTNFALAQEANSQPLPDPVDAQIAAPPLIYISSLKDYHPFGDQKVESWKELNDNVARVGGWRAYARQAQEPDSSEVKLEVQQIPASEKMKPMDHTGHTK